MAFSMRRRRLAVSIVAMLLFYTVLNIVGVRHENSEMKEYVKLRQLAYAKQLAAGIFKPRLSKQEKELYMVILLTFANIMEKHNLTYMIYSGALLGSYRHHGMVPWDDDIDVLVPQTEANKIWDILSSLKPHYFVAKGIPPLRWKFYSYKSRQIRYGVEWKFPFIDICFYELEGNIMKETDKNNKKFKYNLTDVFPMKKRPFEGIMVNVPRNTKKALTNTYDISECVENTYFHKLERERKREIKRKPMTVACEELMPVFPFVFRNVTPHGVIETLELNGKVLSTWIER